MPSQEGPKDLSLFYLFGLISHAGDTTAMLRVRRLRRASCPIPSFRFWFRPISSGSFCDHTRVGDPMKSTTHWHVTFGACSFSHSCPPKTDLGLDSRGDTKHIEIC